MFRSTVTGRICKQLALALCGTLSIAWVRAAPIASPGPVVIAPGVWMIPGGMLANREPDGNSVIFETPAGLAVVDTGRHQWHRDAILSLARVQKKDIVAIVNSHWHLDHVSGNPMLRAAYPHLMVYASDAIDEALTGFLASSAKESGRYLGDPQIPAGLRDDVRMDVSTIQNGAALKPDVVITTSGLNDIGGRPLRVRLAKNAATAGDVWLYDERVRVAVLGDLVTLPAPFLDTACPDGWELALAKISSTPFKTAIPGHGAPMSHPQFVQYRQAFETFIDCARSAAPKRECATVWANSVQPLLGPDSRALRGASETATYYVDVLRANGGHSKYCPVR